MQDWLDAYIYIYDNRNNNNKNGIIQESLALTLRMRLKLYAEGDAVRKLHKYDRNAFHLQTVNESVYQSPEEENSDARLALLQALQAQHKGDRERKVESMVFPSWNQLQKEAHGMQVESMMFPSWNQLQKEAHGTQGGKHDVSVMEST